MPKILLDDEIAESINSLNSKEVFNVVLTRSKDYLKYDGHDQCAIPQ